MANEVELSLAEKNHQRTQELIKSAQIHFLEIGRLLLECRDNKYWTELGYDKFRDYCEVLNIGDYSTCSRMMDIARCIMQQFIKEEDVIEIGMGKMYLLLPRLKNGALDSDTMDVAKFAPQRDLREYLGKTVVENDVEAQITCPNCGETIFGAKYVKKEATN